MDHRLAALIPSTDLAAPDTEARRVCARTAIALALITASIVSGCGGRTGLAVPDASGETLDAGGRRDGGSVVRRDGGFDSGADAGLRDAGIPPVDAFVRPDAGMTRDAGAPIPDAGCIPVADACGDDELCGNGSDDDCDGEVDEGCGCKPGSVQPCFAGPPGRRHIGACSDGEQTCTASGTWAACIGGILPRPDACNGTDNLCDGCSAQRDCPIDCPSPGDVRVPDGHPFTDYVLDATRFYGAPIRSVSWRVTGGVCDRLSPRLSSFDLRDASSARATLRPKLSGDYTVDLALTTATGAPLACTFVVHVEGPGLRVEMCYPESETLDADLYLHRPDDTGRWFEITRGVASPNASSCGWHNCEASIRGGLGTARADWGYMASPLSECSGGPLGAAWSRLGFCANPRLDIDNNLSEGTGLPENINVDAPADGQRFRVGVYNFSGPEMHPVVNVYCSGRRVATYGTEPDTVRGFTWDVGTLGRGTVGAFWRVADVTTRITSAGETACEVEPLHPPGTTTGYDVTVSDARF